jgi:hypothetical protein
MAVLKKTKSGNALMFIDEEGNAFTISSKIVSAILGGYQKGDFAVLTRLPMKVSADRFPKSPVFMSPDSEVKDKDESLSTTNDALSQKQNKKNQENFSKFDDITL